MNAEEDKAFVFLSMPDSAHGILPSAGQNQFGRTSWQNGGLLPTTLDKGLNLPFQSGSWEDH
jgi:hypothetical protein